MDFCVNSCFLEGFVFFSYFIRILINKMTSGRKNSLIETKSSSENLSSDDLGSTQDKRRRSSLLGTAPWVRFYFTYFFFSKQFF